MGGRPTGPNPAGSGKARPNRDTDTLKIVQHVTGRKAQRPKPLPGQHGIAHGIMAALRPGAMMRAIHFNHQAFRVTDEIQHIATKRRLAAEMVAVLTQRAGAGDCLRPIVAHHRQRRVDAARGRG